LPVPGMNPPGNVKDNGDGSYVVDVVWDSSVTPIPGVVTSQPDRNPVTLTPIDGFMKPPHKDCSEPAEDLLDCLGLKDSDVKNVRVKRVLVEIDLDCAKDCEDSKEPKKDKDPKKSKGCKDC